MDDQTELHWRYMKDNLDHSRHHEALRATTTNIILVVAGAGLTIVGYDRCVTLTDLPVLAFVFFLGIFRAFFCAKQTERASLHYARARALRREIDKGPHKPNFDTLKKAADAKHDSEYPWLSARELRSFWLYLHISISLLALALAAIWWQTVSCPK